MGIFFIAGVQDTVLPTSPHSNALSWVNNCIFSALLIQQLSKYFLGLLFFTKLNFGWFLVCEGIREEVCMLSLVFVWISGSPGF